MTTLDVLIPTKLPIERDIDGVFRVGSTRVRLETIVTAFNMGASAEDIASKYPTLYLADIYSVIAYYLHNQPIVDAYLFEREEQMKRANQEIAHKFPNHGIRERLLARRAEQ